MLSKSQTRASLMSVIGQVAHRQITIWGNTTTPQIAKSAGSNYHSASVELAQLVEQGLLVSNDTDTYSLPTQH